jgi:hypothetical protein
MGNKAAVATVKAKADRHAEDVLPIIEDIWHSGTQTLGGIATALNERGILTMRKAKWYPATVKSLLARSGLRRLHPVAGERVAHRFELPDGRDAPSVDHAHEILGTATRG